MVHYGQVAAVGAARRQVLTAAYAAHPERFVRRPPVPPTVPDAVWINPPTPSFTPGPPSAAAAGPARLEPLGVRQ
jgi:putative transposase